MAFKCYTVVQASKQNILDNGGAYYPGGGYRIRCVLGDNLSTLRSVFASITGASRYLLPYLETESVHAVSDATWLNALQGDNPAANSGAGNGLINEFKIAGIEYLELGNEINNQGPKGEPTTVAAADRTWWDRYIDFLRMTSPLLREQGIGCMLSSHDSSIKGTFFWDYLESKGAFKYVDAAAIHLYSGGVRAPNIDGSKRTTTDPGADMPGGPARSIEKLNYCRGRLDNIGYPRLDLWVTEVGWETADTSSIASPDDKLVNWTQQADSLHKGDNTGIFDRFLAVADTKRIRLVSWFIAEDFQTATQDYQDTYSPTTTVSPTGGRSLPASPAFTLNVVDTNGLVTTHGDCASGNKVISNVTSFVGIVNHMQIDAGFGFPPGTQIADYSVSAGTITMDTGFTGTPGTGKTLQFGFPDKGFLIVGKNVIVQYTGKTGTSFTGCTATVDTVGAVANNGPVRLSHSAWAEFCGLTQDPEFETPPTQKPAWARMVTVGAGQGLAGINPTVTTEPVVTVGANSATLPATVNAHGKDDCEYRFEYGLDENYGLKTPYIPMPDPATSTAVAVQKGITGLQSGKTYHYRAVSISEAGKSWGPDMTFDTTGGGGGGAGVYRTPDRVIPGGKVVVETDEFVDGSESPEVPLDPDTDYYTRLVATNVAGTSYGVQKPFHTLSASALPEVATGTTTKRGAEIATVHGSVNPEGHLTNFHFEWGTTSAMPLRSADTDAGSGSVSLGFSHAIEDLLPNTLYYYRIVASNVFGTSFGDTLTFRTTLIGHGQEGGPTDVTPLRPFDLRRLQKVKWEFHLANSDTMQRVGLIDQGRDRNLQLVWNKPGACSFTVPIQDEMFANVEPVRYAIIAYRNKDPIWSGPIWTMDDNLPGRIQVNAVGWFELLNHRILRKAISYPRYATPPLIVTGGEIVFDDPVGTIDTDGYYPGGLLTQANAQRDTWIVEGTTTDRMRRVISYEIGQNIGEAITALSEVEAGFDFTIHPITRVMTISNWNEVTDDSNNAVFGYNWGPNNLQAFARQLDASSMANRVTGQGTYGGGLAEDLPAQQTYQLFEERTDLSGVVDPNILLAFAGGEVVIRSRPRVVYNMTPFPWSTGRIPEPFIDFNLGSIVKFSAKKAPRINIENQKVRIFGMTISISNEGNETIGPLQVTPT